MDSYIDTRGPWPVHIKGLIVTELRPGIAIPEPKPAVPQEIEYPE